MTPVDLLIIDRDRVDWELLRQQKATLFAISFQLGVKIQQDQTPSSHDIQTYARLEGLLGFLDYIQDQAALTLGERTIFGLPEEDDHDEG